MADLRTRFGELDGVVVPDLWADIQRRASSHSTAIVRSHTTWRARSSLRTLSPTMLVLLTGLLVATLGGGILIGSWLNGPTPSVDASTAPTTTVLGCILDGALFQPELDLGEPACEVVAARAVAHLPAGRGTPFAIIVRFIVCPDLCVPLGGGPRDGVVTVEFADGGVPIELDFTGPPYTSEFQQVDRTWSGPRAAVSPRVDGAGPFPFSLPHCGLSWFVDFDGSFWVPVGLIDGRMSAVINAEQGEMRLLSPDRAQFRGESGFTAQVARFPGPKHIWLCA